ncbi:MAG: hypothetical protein ACRDTD_11010 [Pseudonocardiaceae bacterium]
MDRRDFFEHIATLTLGAAVAGLDIERLIALLPQAEPTGTRHLGAADTAVSVGHQAIDAVTALHSPRAYDRLRVLNTALQPLHPSAGIAELRDRLTTTAA